MVIRGVLTLFGDDQRWVNIVKEGIATEIILKFFTLASLRKERMINFVEWAKHSITLIFYKKKLHTPLTPTKINT